MKGMNPKSLDVAHSVPSHPSCRALSARQSSVALPLQLLTWFLDLALLPRRLSRQCSRFSRDQDQWSWGTKATLSLLCALLSVFPMNGVRSFILKAGASAIVSLCLCRKGCESNTCSHRIKHVREDPALWWVSVHPHAGWPEFWNFRTCDNFAHSCGKSVAQKSERISRTQCSLHGGRRKADKENTQKGTWWSRCLSVPTWVLHARTDWIECPRDKKTFPRDKRDTSTGWLQPNFGLRNLYPSFGGGIWIWKFTLTVAKIAFFAHGAFVPCQKQGGFKEKGENDDCAIYKHKVLLQLPLKTTRIARMAGSLW